MGWSLAVKLYLVFSYANYSEFGEIVKGLNCHFHDIDTLFIRC